MPKYVCRVQEIVHSGDVLAVRGQEVDPKAIDKVTLARWLKNGTVSELEEPKPPVQPKPAKATKTNDGGSKA